MKLSKMIGNIVVFLLRVCSINNFLIDWFKLELASFSQQLKLHIEEERDMSDEKLTVVLHLFHSCNLLLPQHTYVCYLDLFQLIYVSKKVHKSDIYQLYNF